MNGICLLCKLNQTRILRKNLIMADIGFFHMAPMVSSWILLVFAREPGIHNQETLQIAECIRDIAPSQIYLMCCVREHNCSIQRQQQKGLECVSKLIANETMMMVESRETGSSEFGSSIRGDRSSRDDVIRSMSENCRRLPKARQITCIKNELTKYCREERGEFRSRQDRRRTPSASALWDSPFMSEIYPIETSRYRDSMYGEGSYYPRTRRMYRPRRFYGRGLGSLENRRLYSSAYDSDSSDEEEEEGLGYEPLVEESHSRYK